MTAIHIIGIIMVGLIAGIPVGFLIRFEENT